VKVSQREREEVRSAMRESVDRSGLTQAEFARAIGTSATRLSTYLSGATIPSAAMYLRTVRLGPAIELAIRHELMAPDRATAAIDTALATGEEDYAIRMVLQSRDDLRANPDARPAWSYRTTTASSHTLDALLRAVIEQEFADDPPAWTAADPLPEDWLPEDPFRSSDQVRSQTPQWLARHRIFIADRALQTA